MMNTTRRISSKSSIQILAWECPACGVGVRGDVKVCPNCVKRANRIEITSNEDLIGSAHSIAEHELIQNMKRFGLDVDMVKAGGVVTGMNIVKVEE